jgi:hypothetical protein
LDVFVVGAGGIEPSNNPLLHKDFSLPARRLDSIFDSKAPHPPLALKRQSRTDGMDAGKRLALIRVVGPDLVAGFRIWLPSGSRNKIGGEASR